MAKYASNSIILTKKEQKIYNKKLDEVTSLVEYTEVLKEMFALADFKLEINWNPTFKLFTKWDKVIPCFHSKHISGKNIDLTGQDRRVYSLSVGTGKAFDRFVRMETGSGGGGENWSYDNAFIDIRKFPGILKQYPTVITDAMIAEEKLKFQTGFDNELQEILYKIESSERSAKYSPTVVKLETQLKQLRQLESHITSLISSTITQCTIGALKIADITVPTKTDSAFLDLTTYNKVINKLNSIHPSEVLYKQAMSEAESKFNEFCDQYPEHFV